MMKVLSDIYPPEIKPVRDGWYLTQDAHIYMPGENPWVLREHRLGLWLFGRHGTRDFRCRWRGVAFDPAAAETYRRHIINIDGVDGRTRPVDGVFLSGATCA